jgi:hypothetical protein
MAKAKRVSITKKPDVQLVLTDEEALVLYAILVNVGGEGEFRELSDGVMRALRLVDGEDDWPRLEMEIAQGYLRFKGE